MKKEVKPGFSKEYANRVDKLTFTEHFEHVYPTVDLGSEWEKLQEEKKEPEKETKVKK